MGAPVNRDSSEIVMAKVIEFYVPQNFRNPFLRPLSPNPVRLSSFVRRQRSRSRLDRPAGSLGGCWQLRSLILL